MKKITKRNTSRRCLITNKNWYDKYARPELNTDILFQYNKHSTIGKVILLKPHPDLFWEIKSNGEFIGADPYEWNTPYDITVKIPTNNIPKIKLFHKNFRTRQYNIHTYVKLLYDDLGIHCVPIIHTKHYINDPRISYDTFYQNTVDTYNYAKHENVFQTKKCNQKHKCRDQDKYHLAHYIH